MKTLKLLAAVLAFLAAGACAARELVIGQVAPIMDPLLAGFQMKSGIELYFDAVNAGGGVFGNTLKLVAVDRASAGSESSKDAVDKTRELIEASSPVALIGFLGTGPMEALVKEGVIARAGLPVLGIRTGATSLHSPENTLLYHTRASYAAEADRMVRHLTTMGLKRIAVFHEKSAFGKEALTHTLAALDRAKLKPVATATYELNTADVGAALRTLQAAQPEAVIAASASVAAAQLYKGLQASSSHRVQMVAFSTVDAPTVIKLIGPEAAHGLGIAQVVPDPGSRKTPLAREFQDNARRFRDPKFELTQGALEGYLAAKVLVEGLRRAGPNLTPARLKAALDKLVNYDTGGVVISFSTKNHSGSNFVNIGILGSDGRLMN